MIDVWDDQDMASAAIGSRFDTVETMAEFEAAILAMRAHRRRLTFVEMMAEHGAGAKRVREQYGVDAGAIVADFDAMHPTLAARLYAANIDRHPGVVAAIARALGYGRVDLG